MPLKDDWENGDVFTPTAANDMADAVNAFDFDFRLDDTRTPTDGSVTASKLDSTFASTLVRTDSTGQAITSPKINSIKDSNGNNLLDFSTTASAVNYLQVVNAAALTPPSIYSQGSDSSVGLTYLPKGAGRFTIFCTSGNTPTIAASGLDANVDLDFIPKGAGAVKVNGSAIVVQGGALGTPASGNLSSCTFPTLNQNTTGNAATATNLVASTSSVVGLGSLEIGHASDTTLARSAAGVLTVEGVELVRRTIQTVTTSTTLGSVGDYIVSIGSGGSITLPTAVSNTVKYTIKNSDTTTKTLATTSSQTIDGYSTVILYPKAVVDLISDGSNWQTFTSGLDARAVSGNLEIYGGYWTAGETAGDLRSGQESVQRGFLNGATSPFTGYSRMAMFTARKTETSTQVRFVCTTAAAGAGSVTALYVGLYTVNSDDSLTRVAVTANTTTAATSTGIKTLSWTSSYSMVAGQRYAISIAAEYTSATAPQFLSSNSSSGATTELSAAYPARCANPIAASGIPPETYTKATIDASTSNAAPYFVVLP